MLDPRFDWIANRHHQEVLDRQADDYIAALGDASVLLDEIRSWERTYQPASVGTTEDANPGGLAVASLPFRRAGSRFDALANALDHSAESSSTDEPVTRAAERLLARGLASAVAQGTVDEKAFDRVTRLFSEAQVDSRLFEDEFCAAVPPSARSAWIRCLATFDQRPEELVDWFRARDGGLDAMAADDLASRSQGLRTYAWSRHDESCVLRHRWVSRARALLALEPESLIGAIEALPLRELRQSALFFIRLHEDREAILRLLRLAPPVFTTSSWTGSTFGLLVLEAGLDHATKLRAVVEGAARGLGAPAVRTEAAALLPALHSNEIVPWLEQLFATAASRADGRSLSLFFGAHVLREHLQSDQRTPGRAEILTAVCSAIEKALGPQLLTVEFQQAAILGAASQGVGTSQTSNSNGASAYMILAAYLAADTIEAWRWYHELLVAADKDLSRSVFGDVPEEFAMLGSALLQAADPVGVWREAWRALFRQREAARFRTVEPFSLHPSRHLVRVAFTALNLGSLPTHVSSSIAEALWRAARLALDYLPPDSARALRGEGPFHRAAGWRLARGVFGARWGELLDEHRAALGADDEYLVVVCSELIRGGLSQEEVLRELGARHLKPLDAMARADGQMSESRREPLPAWIDACNVARGHAGPK